MSGAAMMINARSMRKCSHVPFVTSERRFPLAGAINALRKTTYGIEHAIEIYGGRAEREDSCIPSSLITAADAATLSPTRYRRLEQTPKAHRPS
jgi:hypothetical protein